LTVDGFNDLSPSERGFVKYIGPVLVLAAGFTFGVLIWWLSPEITGRVEPWDAKSPYYVGSLFVSGLIAGVLSPRHAFLAPIGIFFGQFTLGWGFPPSGGMWPLGLFFGAVYCMAAAAGAAIVFACWVKLRKKPQ
jgi:hypothetical protein